MKFFLKGMLWTLVAVVLVGISPSWADIGWQKLNGPHGPDIVAVDVDHTELREIYAGLDGGGVYKSPDGGYEWFRVGEDIPEMWACADLVTDPNDIGAIYVGCWWEGLFRSQDAGDTWQRISNPSNFRTAWSIALDPVVPNRIVVGTRSYIWISTDNGISWEQKTAGLTNPKIFCVVIDPSDPTILYAGNTFGSQPRLYKSTDAGETWSFSDSGLTANANIADIAVNPSDNNIVFAATDAGIYRSTDGGSTWVVSAGVDSISFPRDIEFDAHDHNVIHVASWGGIYTSTDGGISWQRSSPLNETPFYKGLAVDPNVNGALYGGGFGGVLKSTDHGSTWEPMSNDGFALDVQIADDNLWVDPRNSQRLFAGTFGGGVFKSDDGGQSWVGINSGLSCAWTNGGGCCGYLNNSLVLYIGTDGGGLYRSYDVGQSWQAVNNGVNKLTVQEMEMDPTDPLTLYLIADSLYKSYDGGDSWSVPTTNPACVRFRGIAVDSVNPQIVYASASPGVYKSYDGGETWLDISGPLAASKCGEVELDPYDSDIVYITTRYDGLFKSTDGGTNWIDLNEGLPEYEGEIRVECDVAINPKNTDEVYVGLFHNGVFKSVDGGEHWNNWSHGLGNLRINALTLDPQNLSTVYVGTGAGAFRRVPPPTMVIEKTHGTLQGHYQDVSITLEDYELEMGGFDFLIAYDASALGFMEAEPGQLLEDCGWEYFTYRYGADGNCGDACPSGMVRVVGLAETNNGANYPSCYGPPDVDPHELARIKFLVSNDRTLECQYVPIRFFWANCGDNTISDVTGD
ncbi:MAG: hypothetical protein GY841_05545, partial [FCB group bacterium]|nr:hypothetical protein [FCB group bacterium]